MRRVLLVVGLLLALAAVAYFLLRRAKPDSIAAAHANARGVGQMEQFQYGPAIDDFEEAVRRAPDWDPAKINLGIALLNTQLPENLTRGLGLFNDVLSRNPNDAHAHFTAGIIHYYRNQLPEALAHFQRVTEIDPSDAHAWYFLGQSRDDEPTNPDSKKDYERALRLNPYLNAARYKVAQHVVGFDPDASRAMLAEHRALIEANWESETEIKYTMMGRYAEVIGKMPAAHPPAGAVPMFEKLAPTVTGLGPPPATIDPRHGLSLVLLDFNGDGKPDLLVPAGDGFDLLRNDGGNRFTQVGHFPGTGASVADFNNDGRPDIAFTGPMGLRLFTNVDGTHFRDDTAAAGFDKVGPCRVAEWLDLDQDGDLDLVVAGAELYVFTNAGVAPPSDLGQPVPPLSTSFLRVNLDALKIANPVGILALDLDADGDIDLVVLVDGQKPTTILNDRLMRFHRGDDLPTEAANWNGGLVIDANGDDLSDIVLLPAGKPPVVLLSKGDKPNSGYAPGATNAPPLKHAHRADIDLDGRSDIVGLGDDGKLVLLQGDGNGKFELRPDAFPLANALGVNVADFDGDNVPDLVAMAPDLTMLRSLGNGNRGVKLTLTGKRDRRDGGQMGKNQRTNADGIGARVVAHAGPLRAFQELTTLSASRSRSRLPLLLGVGKASAAEAVRVRWPDLVTQAELNQPAEGTVEIVENNRKPTSCPILFTWDGTRYAFVSDCLGAGATGESGPDGSVRPPRPEESVKIEPHQMKLVNGEYRLRLAEPMDEVMYLDHLKLEAIDHPKAMSVYADERFVFAEPQPSQQLLAFAERYLPTKATDHRGRDVTAKLRARDSDAVNGFAVRSWLGYAEEHFVELDFGPAQKALGTRRAFLMLAGWTEYPFPEAMIAAGQAGVELLPPVLEQRRANGAWKPVADLGFPAGLSRVMTKEVTGLLDPAGGPLRIRTNMQVFWDRIELAPLAELPPVRSLAVSRAELEVRGFAQEIGGGNLPTAYDYDRRESVSVTRWKGRLTKLGDVTELLAAKDDRHVVCGPGDEVSVRFDARSLPPVPAGFERSFVLRTHGYCKDTAPTTMAGGRVGPLPYAGMPTYPYDVPPKHVAEYDAAWNTRVGAGGR